MCKCTSWYVCMYVCLLGGSEHPICPSVTLYLMFFLLLCICLHVCTCATYKPHAQESIRGTRSPGTGVTNDCESPCPGWILCKSSKCYSTVEPPLQAPPFVLRQGLPLVSPRMLLPLPPPSLELQACATGAGSSSVLSIHSAY